MPEPPPVMRMVLPVVFMGKPSARKSRVKGGATGADALSCVAMSTSKPIIGRKTWALAEGYIPAWSHGPEPEFTSHDAFCVLNANDEDARLEVTIYFTDREPAGPYVMTVPARRTRHFRFNSLTDPEPLPRGTDYASVFHCNVPVIIQHTRLDSRQAENALMTTMAFPGAE